MQLEKFLQILERNKAYLTSQQYRTLKGAAEAGDVNGAEPKSVLWTNQTRRQPSEQQVMRPVGSRTPIAN